MWITRFTRGGAITFPAWYYVAIGTVILCLITDVGAALINSWRALLPLAVILIGLRYLLHRRRVAEHAKHTSFTTGCRVCEYLLQVAERKEQELQASIADYARKQRADDLIFRHRPLDK